MSEDARSSEGRPASSAHQTSPSSEERSILDLLSFFFDGASFDMMRSLSGKEEYELITILENLIDKKLIREVIRAESVAFQFSHQKILEYVYGELSLTKRRILPRAQAQRHERGQRALYQAHVPQQARGQ